MGRTLKDRAERDRRIDETRDKAARRALWPHPRTKGKSAPARAASDAHDFVIAPEVTSAPTARKTLCKADRLGRRAQRPPPLKENPFLFNEEHRL
jgi:hypothetical protein